MTVNRLVPSLLVACLVASSANAEVLRLHTTAPGSFSSTAGDAIAKAVNQRADVKLIVQPSGAEGYRQIINREADLGMTTAHELRWFVTGTGIHTDAPPDRTKLRLVYRLVPLRVAAFVRADSNIQSIKDLRGKRVPADFTQQRQSYGIVKTSLVGAGLSEDDIVKVPVNNVVQAAHAFGDGKLDVFWFALGTNVLKTVSDKVGELRALSAETSSAAMAAMQKHIPGGYIMTIQPTPALPQVKKPTLVVAYDHVVFTSVDVSAEAVYRIVRATFESKPEIAAAFPPLNQFDPKQMAKPYDHLEYHPGAVKFFKEQNIWLSR